MTKKRETPPVGTGGARECLRLGSFDSPENITTPALHAMRVAHLARRYQIDAAVANVVAALIFETAERTR